MPYDENNIFAKILRGEASAHRVYEDEHTMAFMDVMPQADGHTLVVPKTPAENLFDLDPEAAAQVTRTVQVVAAAVRSALQADGIIITQFNGPAAGQTVFHYHVHIIPRWEGSGLRGHGRGMADDATLASHAEQIRAVLESD